MKAYEQTLPEVPELHMVGSTEGKRTSDRDCTALRHLTSQVR